MKRHLAERWKDYRTVLHHTPPGHVLDIEVAFFMGALALMRLLKQRAPGATGRPVLRRPNRRPS